MLINLDTLALTPGSAHSCGARPSEGVVSGVTAREVGSIPLLWRRQTESVPLHLLHLNYDPSRAVDSFTHS